MSATDSPAATRRLTVRLFGPQARLAGADAVTITLPENATVAEIRSGLSEACEPLRPSLSGSRIAVNHEYVSESEPVAFDAEVALIGLVSGG
ncbi:MoaD/ThiS family protein [Alienimonas chondri]|uniref:MoaD/ThiS family protein n=1 Tax=Alienimonas chondri TaxID=2681879 RepID=A0ABX1V7R4_9PLAN|nr:MoaD/ThiS family protein [Alienimonas chondri]NNJ24237.1 hypothetical protein [Alienimonas chondri]